VFKINISSCWIWKYSSFTCFLRNQLSQHPRRFCWPPPCLQLASHFEFLTSRIGWYFPTSQYFNIRKSRPQIVPVKFSDYWNWNQRLNFPIIGKIFGNPAHSLRPFTIVGLKQGCRSETVVLSLSFLTLPSLYKGSKQENSHFRFEPWSKIGSKQTRFEPGRD
jgi:hypothetical protein